MGQMAIDVGTLLLFFFFFLLVFCGSVKAVGEGSEGPKTGFSSHPLPRLGINGDKGPYSRAPD